MLSTKRNIKSETMSFVKQRDELSNLNSRSAYHMLGFHDAQFSTMIGTAALSIGEMRPL
jgi:hypothetical protein